MLYLPYILFSTISYVPGKLSVEQKLIDLALTGIFTDLSVILLGIPTKLQHICKYSNPIVCLHLTQYTQACLH